MQRCVVLLLIYRALALELLFGQSSALTGVASDIGTSMRNGTNAAFSRVNNKGGVNGNNFTLLSLDDAYDPILTYNNTLQLIESNVIAALSYCGTATTLNALNLTLPRRIPMLAPFTGARSLRTNRYVVNLRAGYDDEVFSFVQFCLSRGLTIFSILYQDDGFGSAGFDALSVALDNLGINILSSASFPIASGNVTLGLTTLESVGISPEVIMMIGTGIPLARFVAQAKIVFPSAIFYSVSFLGSETFLSALQSLNVSDGTDIFVSQAFPIPQPLPLLTNATAGDLLFDFAVAMSAWCPGCPLTFGALEGYVAGTFVTQVFQRMGALSITNDEFNKHLLAENVSDFDFNNTNFLAAVREYFLEVVYTTEVFYIGGLRLGPFVQDETCVADVTKCLQPAPQFCTQGMHNVFLTQPQVSLGQFLELTERRIRWEQCDVHSQPVDPLLIPLVFGQTALMSGISSSLGKNMRDGILAAFVVANKSPQRGIRSRQLLLLTYDDQSEPSQAILNARHMIDNQSLIAVLGATSTPTTTATVPLFSAAKLPLIGPFTGNRALRGNDYIINVRAGYDDEAAAIVSYCFRQNWTKLALLRQDDVFGDAGASAMTLALNWHKKKLSSVAFYPARTAIVQPAFDNFTRDGQPEVVVMFATAEAAAAFVTLAEANNAWNAANVKYFCVSYVSIESFRQQVSPLLFATPKLFYSAVVPYFGSNLTIARNYKQALSMLDPSLNPTFGSLEGYLVGRLVIYALERSLTLTSEGLIQEIFSTRDIPLDDLLLGPFVPQSGGTDACNQGLRETFIFRLDANNVTTEIETFRAEQSSRVFDCGTLGIYSDPPCPTGYKKRYTSTTTLESVCELCLSQMGCDFPFFQTSQGLRWGLVALNGFGFLLTLCALAVVLRYRRSFVMRASSPPFCVLILVGSLIGYCIVFVLAPGLEDWNCMTQIYLINISFSFLYGALFVKIYRVAVIFNQKSVRVISIKDQFLFIVIGVLLSAELIFTGVWHALDPLVVTLEQDPAFLYYSCRTVSGTTTWAVANILGNGILLAYGILLTIQSRNIPTAFNESRYLAATLYNAFCVGSILIGAAYSSEEDDRVFLFKSLAVFLVCTVGVCLLFYPKFVLLHEEATKGKVPAISTSALAPSTPRGSALKTDIEIRGGVSTSPTSIEGTDHQQL